MSRRCSMGWRGSRRARRCASMARSSALVSRPTGANFTPALMRFSSKPLTASSCVRAQRSFQRRPMRVSAATALRFQPAPGFRRMRSAPSPHPACAAKSILGRSLASSSHVDNGSHADMDAALLRRSARVLQPFSAALAMAGAEGAPMGRLRAIGLAAEARMLSATGGINAHRGAIFGLGLLCAAAGVEVAAARRSAPWCANATAARSLRAPSRREPWRAPARVPLWRGRRAGQRSAGFPSVYDIGAPALAEGRSLAPHDAEAARVQAIFALIAAVADTNLLHRGGAEGLLFARARARDFLQRGGVGAPDWRGRALAFMPNSSPAASAPAVRRTCSR